MTDRDSPLRIGPRPEPVKRTPRARKHKAKASVPAVVRQPDEPLAGFESIEAHDYTEKDAKGRYLTVSPLRAIMAEELTREGEHVPTERTRQGVLYGTGLGIENRVMAILYGMETDEFERVYTRELATGVHLMMNDIQTNMYNIARDPSHTSSVKAGMYLLGKLGNRIYREEKRLDALSVNPQTRTIDVGLLSEEDRDALKQILTSALQLASSGRQPAIEGRAVEVNDDEEDVL